jgi:hypothetical protein
MTDSTAPPTAFISYSWDDEDHKAWVRELAARLRGDGVDVALDQWALQPGDRLPAFMEAAVRDNGFVIIVCTPHYKERSDARKGGVGYEGDIMTGELLTTRNERKFIPALRQADEATAVPSWLAGKYYVDMREGADHERAYKDLLTTLLGRRESPPPLGSSSGESARGRPSGRVDDAGSSGPIRILGVIADEVSEPLGDGTRGSALYRIPLRLSRRPSAEWAQLFKRTWDHPPRYTTMHRPGILSVQGDRIVLDGTTVEELERYHRDTLVLILEKVNNEIAEREAVEHRRAEAESRRREEHRRAVKEATERLSFDPGSTGPPTTDGPALSEPGPVGSWSIEGHAHAVASQGRDGTGYAWRLRRGDETRSVVVWISGSVMASSPAGLPPEVAEARRTKGRSALATHLRGDEPPAEILVVNTDGVR